MINKDMRMVLSRMNDLDENHIEQVRGMVIGLIFECPRGGNPEHCPGYKMRKLPMEERYKWLMGLNVNELREFYKNHLMCLACSSHKDKHR